MFCRSRLKLRSSLGTLLVAPLLVIGFATPSNASFEIVRHAFGALGYEGTSASFRLGCTAGLPIIGVASGTDLQEIVGFWYWGMPTPSSTESVLPTIVTALLPGGSNPFWSQAVIRFQIGGDDGIETATRLEVFDVAGRSVAVLADEMLAPGTYIRIWDRTDKRGRNVGNGVYFARFGAGPYRKTIRLIALR